MSRLLRKLTRGLAGAMSDTERQALEAGDVWIDGDFFSGRPDLARLLAEPWPELRDDERAFLDGPVEELCAAVDPQELERTRELSAATWRLLREHRFFGLGLPPRYGGHGFSALAQSTIFGKLATRSLGLSSVVLIPNSVGPGELLVEVGTEAQREHYLPRLARGEEIPCFALTEPEAGSDAASLRSRGTVFRGADGELHLRLDFEKRYITLAPIATLIGLAVRLHDPERLLGGREDVGITCVLVPAQTPGVEIGRHHDPMGLPFPNGPLRGRDVVVPIGQIIGGPAQAGQGWRMLMEALSGGRAVSLPAQSVAGAKGVARIAGAYAAVRQQFGTPIARFEGIEEPLARIAGLTYLMDAARVMTCGALDASHRPAVVSALMKYNQTELGRQLAIDGMDILGGAGLSLGPRNLLARAYLGSPIGITVEGANILTRTLIVFGQGAMRSHPHFRRLFVAASDGRPLALVAALVREAAHLLRTAGRTLRLSLSAGRLVRSPGGPFAATYRRLAWAASRFALWADVAILVSGPRLKQRGKLSGRFADWLSWMVLAFATLRRFEAEGRRTEDEALARWASEHAMSRVQEAYEGVLRHLDPPLLGRLLRGPFLAWARLLPMGSPPDDALGARAADAIRRPGALRDRLTAELFLPADPEHPARVLEDAFASAVAAEPALGLLRRAVQRGKLPRRPPVELLDEAVAADILDAELAATVREATRLRLAAIAVDDFDAATYRGRGVGPGPTVAPHGEAEREPEILAGTHP